MNNDITKSKSEEKDESLLSILLFRFAPYWPLFLLLLFMCAAGAWLYLRFSTPLYEASATIMIKDEKKGVNDSKMLESLNIYSATKIVENEMEILKSRSLMEEVVENLHLYAPVYQKESFGALDAYKNSPLYIDVKDPKEITGYNDVPFTYNYDSGYVKIDGKVYPLGEWATTQYGELKFNKNKGAVAGATPETQLLFSLYNPEWIAPSMTGRLNIQATNKFTTVLGLNYTDESPKRAKDVLNELIRVYTLNSIKEKNSMAANTLSFIDERLQYVTKDLDSIEHSIQKYKASNGIVDLSEQSKNFLQNVTVNDRQVSDINMQLAVLDQVESYVLSKNNKSGIVPSSLGINDPMLTQLLQKLYDAELEYDKLKKTLAENTPQVQAVATEIESIRPTIIENVRNQRKSLVASRKNVAETNGMYNSYLKTIPQKERQLLEISRQQSIKNNVYAFLLEKREETALASSSTLADSKLIDSAMSYNTPVSPKKTVAYVGAILLAIFLSVVIVLGRELFTGKILFRSDLEKFTKVPIVAEITSVKHKNELVVNHPDKIFIAEQFRHLRAAIGLHGRLVSKQRVLITSSIPGEGKSFVAANLALSLSLSGKKVLLIDADLRGPKTSSIFDMEEKDGLVEYLEERESFEKVIHTSKYNNLFILPAGGVCNNPTELLLNGRLNELFNSVDGIFDYVLVDTSPIDPVTDAYVLSYYCDKTLFVVRHGYTPKAMVQLLDESNKIKALNNLRIVFNGIKKRGFVKGKYGFGFGYGYEYIYKNRGDLKMNKRTSIS